MAIRDALAQRYPDLSPDTLDKLDAMAGQSPDAVTPDDARGIAGDISGYFSGGASPKDAALNVYDRLAASPKPSELPAGPPRPEDVPGPHTMQDNLRPVDMAAKIQGKDPNALRADLATRGGANPTGDGQVGAPAGGGGVYAGWMPGTRQTQVHEGYSQDELEPLRDVNTDRQGAKYGRMDTEMQMANRQGVLDAHYADAYANEAQKFADHQRLLADERQAYVGEERRKLNELAVQTQKEVDPDAFMKSLGGGGQILAALSVAMGQFGASLTGGQNAALQILQANIDRSIRAQEHNIAQAGKAYDVRTNLLARNMEAFGDREKAIAATRINMLDAVKSQLDSQLANANLSDAERQRGFSLAEKLAEDRQAAEDMFMQRAHSQIVRAQNDHFVVQPTGGAGVGKPIEHTITLQDGTTYQVPEDVHKETMSKVQAHGVIDDLDSKALKLRNELRESGALMDRGAYQTKVGQLQKMAVDRINQESLAQGQGVVKKEEMEQQLQLSPYLKGFGESTAGGVARNHLPGVDTDRDVGDNLIRKQQERSRDAQRALLAGTGASLVQRGFNRDTQGNLTPVGKHTGQYAKPGERLAPNGVSGDNDTTVIPNRGPTGYETTPRAPVFGTTAAPTPSMPTGKRRRK